MATSKKPRHTPELFLPDPYQSRGPGAQPGRSSRSISGCFFRIVRLRIFIICFVFRFISAVCLFAVSCILSAVHLTFGAVFAGIACVVLCVFVFIFIVFCHCLFLLMHFSQRSPLFGAFESFAGFIQTCLFYCYTQKWTVTIIPKTQSNIQQNMLLFSPSYIIILGVKRIYPSKIFFT